MVKSDKSWLFTPKYAQNLSKITTSPRGSCTSVLAYLLRLILSNVSECHQFKVIKLIISQFLSVCQEWIQCDPVIVKVNFKGAFTANIHDALQTSRSFVVCKVRGGCSIWLRPFEVLRLQLSIFFLSKSNPRGSIYSFRYKNEGRTLDYVNFRSNVLVLDGFCQLYLVAFLQAN